MNDWVKEYIPRRLMAEARNGEPIIKVIRHCGLQTKMTSSQVIGLAIENLSNLGLTHGLKLRGFGQISIIDFGTPVQDPNDPGCWDVPVQFKIKK